MKYKVALVGNPNVGKTSLFNRLTDSFEHVGNWQGVTVGSKSKSFRLDGDEIEVTDLPGLYSLTAYSPEESVTRDAVLEKTADLIVNVCEVNNLARNLYLTVQLLELGVPVLLAVNMIDELRKKGQRLETEKLSNALSVPVVAVSATERASADVLATAVLERLKAGGKVSPRRGHLAGLPAGRFEAEIRSSALSAGLDPGWAAIKVMEGDEYVLGRLELSGRQAARLAAMGDFGAATASARYAFIDRIADEAIVVDEGAKRRHKFRLGATDAIDRLVLNRRLALPIFLAVLCAIFYVTFGLVGGALSDIMDAGVKRLVYRPAMSSLTAAGLPEWTVRLVCDGVIAGVLGVAKFLPQVVLLFFFLALLEDSGYLARVAFMTDGLFAKIGLSGRSVFTLIMGFGCSATAIPTSRGEYDEHTRKKTVLLTPFFSCSARLPVYTTVAGAYFAGRSFLVIFAMYLVGCAAAVFWAAAGERFARTKSGGRSFIMEMPRYRMPTPERVVQIVMHNAKAFLLRVGTVIFSFNVIVWILTNFSLTRGFTSGGEDSILATFSGMIAPVFAPLGFGNWRAVTALLSGLAAKEAVIASIESMGGVEVVFTGEHASLAALSFLTFTALYVPCIAAVSAELREVGPKWTALGAVIRLTTAYAAALAVYAAGLAVSRAPAVTLTAAAAVSVAAAAVVGAARGLRRANCAGCGRCEAKRSHVGKKAA